MTLFRVLATTSLLLPAHGEAVRIATTNYHGWAGAIVMSNGKAEVVVVPEIGRIMQFRLAGEEDGPFFENPALFGKSGDPNAKDWLNFGGDKTWPAPQSAWPKIARKGWPPPSGFDAVPNSVEILGDRVLLSSPVDPDFGIRARREIILNPNLAKLEITTRYTKVSKTPRRVGVWIITQLKDPQRVFVSAPKNKGSRDGYIKQSDELPAELARSESILSMKRDAQHSAKIGTEAETLIWTDAKHVLTITCPRRAEGEYPDEGSSAEVYTNPDPLKYVELEMLGPLKTLGSGDQIESTSTYRLFSRGTPEAAEALKRAGIAP